MEKKKLVFKKLKESYSSILTTMKIFGSFRLSAFLRHKKSNSFVSNRPLKVECTGLRLREDIESVVAGYKELEH